MEMKYRLDLIGITYNQIESGVYAVILQQAGGTRRIPIIIGYPEAQAIECKLQKVVTPRPLTHDMMANMMKEFGIVLKRVEIKKLPSGVFAADLIFFDGIDIKVVDSRSSDAIALAIRVGAPIYTSAEVLEEAGFDPMDSRGGRQSAPERGQCAEPEEETKILSVEELLESEDITYLQIKMQNAADNENYEEAARIREIIRRRKEEEGEE